MNSLSASLSKQIDRITFQIYKVKQVREWLQRNESVLTAWKTG